MRCKESSTTSPFDKAQATKKIESESRYLPRDIESLPEVPVYRFPILILVLLLISTPVVSQTGPDSKTLQALLEEVRQLRRDLRSTTVAAQRAQILVYRVQAQESVVRRMQERVDDTRSRLAQMQSEQKRLTAAVKQNQDLLDNTDNQATRKE